MSVTINQKTHTCGSLLLSTHSDFEPHDVEVFFAGVKNIAESDIKPIIIDVSESSELQLKSFSDGLEKLSSDLSEKLALILVLGLDRFGDLSELKKNLGEKVQIVNESKEARFLARDWSENMEEAELELYIPHIEKRFSELNFDEAFESRNSFEKSVKTVERMIRLKDHWEKKKNRIKSEDSIQSRYYQSEMLLVQKLTMKFELLDGVLKDTSNRKMGKKVEATPAKPEPSPETSSEPATEPSPEASNEEQESDS